MLIKTFYPLAGMLLTLSLSAVSVIPANAEPSNTQNTNQSSELLLSQLRGHDTYNGKDQITFANYKIGTVKGQTGSIVSVILQDGTSVNSQVMPYNPADDVGVTYEGKNVLVAEEDGIYTIVGLAHPPWILNLVDKYGLKLPEPESTSTPSTPSGSSSTTPETTPSQ